ncbi:Cyclin-dependent kinases regulatory subunit (Cell division control protein cks1) [Acarospora aff. strigata]|nr:Cyclin-dependent kinases regulatory subunit (Cell division control protein cks1) [Acarospora aff. strigata]
MASLDHDRRNKKPRLLTEPERERLDEFVDSIHYSARYSDNEYEYRHVQLPKNMLKAIPKEYFDPSKGTLKLLWEDEWRGLGITQARKHAVNMVRKSRLTLHLPAELGLGTL